MCILLKMERPSSSTHQALTSVPVDLVGLPLEVLQEVVTLVALSSAKLEDDGLAALASVSKTYRDVVLGWLKTTMGGEVFHMGTVLSPVMAGFFVHKPNGMWPRISY